MREQYGSQIMTKPEGMLRPVYFPELALTDVFTGDGRLLENDGRGVRDLPLTIYGQFVNEPGHSAAPVVGRLDTVIFDDGVASGYGWLLDDENGRDAVKYLKTSTLRGNSVDLAEFKVKFEFDEDADDIRLRFTNWKIAATTLVGKPAFGTARAELLEDEELVASWMAEEDMLIVDVPLEYNIPVADEEITADGAPVPPWELFHIPESDKPQKLTVGQPTEDGWIPVTGHLALWESCHDGIVGRCTRVPRPDDNYASYNKPGVLTDRGMVGTGPIFLTGGHRQSKNGDYFDAYGGIENAWADVRVTAGTLGPWLSGYVRPGVEDNQVLAARASRISGHWKGSRLKAIVSVNAEGFDVPGDGFSVDAEGHVDELVAGFFPSCEEDDAPVDLTPWTLSMSGTTTTTSIGWTGNEIHFNGDPRTFSFPMTIHRPEDFLKIIAIGEEEAEASAKIEALLALLELDAELADLDDE